MLAFFFGAARFSAATLFATFFFARELGPLASVVVATLSKTTPAAAVVAASPASALAPLAALASVSSNL